MTTFLRFVGLIALYVAFAIVWFMAESGLDRRLLGFAAVLLVVTVPFAIVAVGRVSAMRLNGLKLKAERRDVAAFD